MEYFYHGSTVPGISTLEPRSNRNGSPVLYLTDHIPYALTYIWDGEKIGYQRKHVTAYIKNGIAFYEEQFPDQLKTFYSGVSGYLYFAKKDLHAEILPEHDGIYFYRSKKQVADYVFISDVYTELLKYESTGHFVVARFNEQSREKQNELVQKIAALLVKNDFYRTDPEKAAFYQKYFALAWEAAKV